MKSHLLSEEELIEFVKGENLIDRLRALLDHQKNNWSLASENYANLSSVITKEVFINGAELKVQVNPERVKSTAADIEKLIPQEQCILCETNLPSQQKFLRYYKEYNFLVNPYPIFPEHFTVVKNKHVPQSIMPYFNDLLLISRDVGERYAVFYNGPRCGASLPEHLHFQMGNKEYFPIFDQLEQSKISLSIKRKKITLQICELTGRAYILIESKDAIEIMNSFSVIVNTLKNIKPKESEPMMNLVSSYDENRWQLIIFFRKKHRPHFYYAEEPKKIVVSPAAVDMSSLIILPREQDLNKLTELEIIDMYREVSYSKEYNEYLSSKLKEFYT